MFFYYFGIVTFTIIVAVSLAIFTVSCCKGHWIYFECTTPKLRAYDNKLQYYRIHDNDKNGKWEYLKCTVLRKYRPHNREDLIRHCGEDKPIMVYSIEELNDFRRKFTNYNKILDFLEKQQRLMKDYNSFDEQQRIIE
jgi:hypothetical protein